MPLITCANARQLAAKALIARRANRERQRNLDQRIADLTAKLTALTPVPREQLSGYVEQRLTRVRKQLDRLDDLLSKETNPQRLDRLASAQYRLSEQERILSGRPLPGSRRPSQEREVRRAPYLPTPLGIAQGPVPAQRG